MKFKSINDFKNYKPALLSKSIKIMIGMNTCGISAGADKVYKFFEKEIEKRGIQSVDLVKVGCLGLCFSEPNVEVKVAGLPDVLYGKVNEEFARRILEQHILDKRIIDENIYDKPYLDVLTLK